MIVLGAIVITAIVKYFSTKYRESTFSVNSDFNVQNEEQRGVKSNFFRSDLAVFRKNYSKDKKLFLGIKSGAKGSEIELFCEDLIKIVQ